MSKIEEQTKPKTKIELPVLDREAEVKKVNESWSKSHITTADIDEVLTLLPGTQAQLASMQRYGESPWPVISAIKEKLMELRKKLES